MTDHEKIINDYTIDFESRLSKAETFNSVILQELKEIKRTLRWIIGIIISLSSPILGIVAKGFHLL